MNIYENKCNSQIRYVLTCLGFGIKNDISFIPGNTFTLHV